MAPTVTVSRRTRRLLETLKSSDESFDDVISLLLATHPNGPTWRELNTKFRSDEFEPVEGMFSGARMRHGQKVRSSKGA